MRIDKYLKVSRIIKRRTVASSACQAGRVVVNGKAVKASYDVKVGDIIDFRDGDFIVTHRIVEIKTGYYTTKGDNNNIKDVTKRKKDDIIGIVEFRIPYIGYPSVFVSEFING